MNFGKSDCCEDLASLSPIELALLEHVASVRLTTSDVWDHASPLAGHARQQIGAAVRSLVRAKLLIAGSLYHGRHYFVLSGLAAQLLKVPTGASGLLSEPRKLKAYARQQLVCIQRQDLQLFSISIGSPRHPASGGSLDGFAIRGTTNDNLAFIRVDASFASRPSRSAQTIRNDILRFAKIPSIATHMRAQCFEYVWITMTQSRAEAVEVHFRKYHRVGKSPITFVVMPQLLPLVVSTEIWKEDFIRTKLS